MRTRRRSQDWTDDGDATAQGVRRGDWLSQWRWRLENECLLECESEQRRKLDIYFFSGIRGRGRGFLAQVPATALEGFCPPSPSLPEKFSVFRSTFEAFPARISPT
ncbi:hypothetical protein PIB30_049817 [Stylosanthes scabra]|uniref:Uncharacterized protein n=1 Tax=Stylosanthes scabra TaxID=79078 RepID=A0ABU6VFU3_9FABA|nr:hypothetical protein [Stylosanthes scabra]